MRRRRAGTASIAIEADATWGLREGDSLGEDRRVLTFLAAGRKSEVYLAWDRRRHCTVAVKLPRPGRPVSKLRKEAALLDRLAHPVLVRGYEAALEEPCPHLVLEHIPGQSVRALVRRGPCAPDVVAAVALQVASVLNYLATEGLVHLDVKPHNILLTSPTVHALEPGSRGTRPNRSDGRAPTAKLIDAAAIYPVGSPVKALGGSVPELRESGARAAPPAGVWLLGATMWRMLSGGAEVTGGTGGRGGRSGARDPHAASAYPTVLPAGVPAPLVDLVTACVRREPSERPSAGEVADALEPLVVSPSAASAPPPARPGPRLRRWLASSVGA